MRPMLQKDSFRQHQQYSRYKGLGWISDLESQFWKWSEVEEFNQTHFFHGLLLFGPAVMVQQATLKGGTPPLQESS